MRSGAKPQLFRETARPCILSALGRWAGPGTLLPLNLLLALPSVRTQEVCTGPGVQQVRTAHLPCPPPCLAPSLMCPSWCLADQQNFMVTLDQVLLRCLAHQEHWSRLEEEQAGPEPGAPASLLLAPHPPEAHSAASSLVFSCISHALQWISQGRDPVFQPPDPPQGLLAHTVAGSGADVLREAAAIHVLVTGSLHLVGGVLKLLEPSLSQ